LAAVLTGCGRSVIRATIDGFHRPQAIRHRQGRLSPDGYYEDARDLAAVRRFLLDPLGPGGSRCYCSATFDLERDEPLQQEVHRADDDAVLIVDGTFLQRPELKKAWDFVIFLDVPEEEARRRGVARDTPALRGLVPATELYTLRYGPAFVRYEAECSPRANAQMVIQN
jgi:uridine kinase